MNTYNGYVVRLIAGSHLYGCNVPTSDRDYKSVAFPHARDILLQRAFDSHVNKTNPDNKAKNTSDDVDSEVHSLHRYLSLLMEGQTIALDMLFSPKEFIIEKSPVWDVIVQNRNRFLHRGMTSFVGYCQNQANKYSVKGYRLTAARTIVEFLEAKMKAKSPYAKLVEFEQELRMVVENYRMDQAASEFGDPDVMQIVTISGKGLKPDELHLEVCGRKTPLHNPLVKAHEVFKRVLDNYGRRAHMAEANQGDHKALYHAVRVSSEALELLKTGHITFPRPEAPLLLKIRRGEVPFQEVSNMIHQGLVDIEEALTTTVLPEKPDRAFAEELICGVYKDLIRSEWSSRKGTPQNNVQSEYRTGG